MAKTEINSGKWRTKHLNAINTTALYLGIDEEIILNEFMQNELKHNKLKPQDLKQKFVVRGFVDDNLSAINNRSVQATLANDGIIISKPPVISF